MDFKRYSRQIPMPEIGDRGQRKLLESSALVIGTGGLGSVLLYCLAGAGVGKIGIMDDDTVSISNLNRQFLHYEDDIGTLKVNSAIKKLRAFNSSVCFSPIPEKLTAGNADRLIPEYDITILAVDSIATRYIVNDACCAHGKPLVNGGVDGMTGVLNLIVPGRTPCLRCLYGDDITPVATGAAVTSFAPIVAVISALEAQVAILTLLGDPAALLEKTLYFSGADYTLHQIDEARRADCPACSMLGWKAESMEAANNVRKSL